MMCFVLWCSECFEVLDFVLKQNFKKSAKALLIVLVVEAPNSVLEPMSDCNNFIEVGWQRSFQFE